MGHVLQPLGHFSGPLLNLLQFADLSYTEDAKLYTVFQTPFECWAIEIITGPAVHAIIGTAQYVVGIHCHTSALVAHIQLFYQE